MHAKTTGTAPTLVTEVKNPLASCDSMITPICLRTLYGLFHQPLAAALNSMAVGASTFFSFFRRNFSIDNFNFFYISGIHAPGVPSVRP
jgi:hypothetical protein